MVFFADEDRLRTVWLRVPELTWDVLDGFDDDENEIRPH